MPTPRSLLHLNGVNGSTTVANSVTGASAVAWAFQNAGAGLTTSSPYLGSAMALLNKGSFLNSAAVTPTGDWTLAFRIGITNNSDNGQFAFISQGKAGDEGHWALVLGDDNNIYFFTNSGDIDGGLSGGNAGAVVTKMKAGNAFCVFQWIGGVLSFGMAGSGETSVTRLLSGAFNGGGSPAGAFHFNGRFDSSGVAYPNTGTSRVDEVVFQDGGAIYPTYPFTRPTGEYAFDVAANGSITDVRDTLIAAAQVGVALVGTVQDRSDTAAGVGATPIVVAASVRDRSDAVQATTAVGISAAAASLDRADTVQAAAASGIVAAGTVVDQTDATQGSVALMASVAASAVDAPDTLQAAGNALVSASVAVMDASDVSNAAAAIRVTAIGNVIDAADGLTGALAPSAGVVAVLVDMADVIQAAAAVGVRISATLQDTADQVSAGAQAAVMASAAILDIADAVAGQASAGAVPTAAVGSMVDASDALAATAKLAILVAGSVFDATDLLSAQAQVVRPGAQASASVIDTSDLVVGQAAASIIAMCARTDVSDIVIGSAANPIRAGAVVVDIDDFVTGIAVIRTLPAINVIGAIHDASDVLRAFEHDGRGIYGALSSRRHSADLGQRPTTVFSKRTAAPLRTRPSNVQGRY